MTTAIDASLPARGASPMTVPLNLLDEHFLNLDQEREPWSVHLEVRVGGRLEPERLSHAIGAAVRRHPIARARLASWELSDRTYHWEIADTVDEVPLTVAACPEEALLADARERLFTVTRRSRPRRPSPSSWPMAPTATRSCSTCTTRRATA